MFFTVSFADRHYPNHHEVVMVVAAQPGRDEDSTPPPRKRIRTQATKPKSGREPRLFAPFRALGLVTNHVPFVLQTRSYKGAAEGPTLHLVTCLGKSWAMWEGGRITLQFVGEYSVTFVREVTAIYKCMSLSLTGPTEEHPITSMAMDGKAVWAATGSDAVKYLRGKEVRLVLLPHLS